MKVQKVKIKDFKVLKNIDKDIAGHNVFLIGDNGVGKSSFIQFIKIALGDQSNIPPNATGEGEVITDKDGKQYTFNVKFKDGKPVVTVTTPDGLKDSRKSVLASLVGAMDFDIDKFVELSKSDKGRREQVEVFKSFLSEDVREELKRLEMNVKVAYDERTELNRAIKTKEGSIKENPLYNLVGAGAKFEQVDMTAVYAELKAANDHNTKVTNAKAESVRIAESIERTNAEIEATKAKLSELQTSLSDATKRNDAAQKWLSENQLKDVSEMETKIQKATEINSQFEAAQRLKKDITELEAWKTQAGEMTVNIESQKGLIENAIKDMETPVDGLMFDDEKLVYNGIPVSDNSLSESEIMELGVKLKMAENPELGILFIERGESLGAKRLSAIMELAEKSGWQVIIEEVRRGKEDLTIELVGE